MPDSPASPGGQQNPDAQGEPVAAERFRRTTPARRRSIPARRAAGHWRLLGGTVLYVMAVGGSADYTEPGVRVLGHLVFWALVVLGLLVALGRERRHGWAPGPRWPWAAAALGGTLLVEVLVLAVGSPAIIVGSVIALGLFLFVLMLVG